MEQCARSRPDEGVCLHIILAQETPHCHTPLCHPPNIFPSRSASSWWQGWPAASWLASMSLLLPVMGQQWHTVRGGEEVKECAAAPGTGKQSSFSISLVRRCSKALWKDLHGQQAGPWGWEASSDGGICPSSQGGPCLLPQGTSVNLALIL